MTITLVVIIITALISIAAFNDRNLQYKLMYSPYRVKHHGEWYRVITHAFIHKDWMHLLFNMFVLYQFGEIIEQTLIGIYDVKGSYYFVVLYLGGFLFATIPAMIKHSENDSYWSLGASGAVSAVIFGFILFYPTQKLMLIFLPIPMPAVLLGLLYLSFEIYMDKKGGSGIAHDAHLWGALFGIVYLIALNFNNLVNFIDQIKDLFG